MSKPPKEIDNAKVIEWAWSGSEPFGVIEFNNGGIASKIFGLAICQYKDSKSYYRISCDENWESEQDAEYSSIHDAKINLPAQYKYIEPQWQKYE